MKSGKYGLEKLQIRIFFTQCASPIDFRREKYLRMCKNKPSLVVVYEKKKIKILADVGQKQSDLGTEYVCIFCRHPVSQGQWKKKHDGQPT